VEEYGDFEKSLFTWQTAGRIFPSQYSIHAHIFSATPLTTVFVCDAHFCMASAFLIDVCSALVLFLKRQLLVEHHK